MAKKPKSVAINMSDIILAKKRVPNEHIKIEFKDWTLFRKWLGDRPVFPRKSALQWDKNTAWYEKYYERTPYWVQVTLWGDDDLLLTAVFDSKDKALECFDDILTTPDDTEPDWDKWGFG